MIKLITAKNLAFPVNWAGLSELDGSLRFEVSGSDMATLYSVFSDPEQTVSLTRVFDEDRRTFEGYTRLIRLAQMPTGIVIGLMKGVTE